MIGLVLVTHGNLAQEFLGAMQHIMGPQMAVATVAIGPHDDMERRRADIIAAVTVVEQGAGVIILTDLFGGTPSNLAISLLEQYQDLEVIAGLNLPMLLKLATVRKTATLAEAVQQTCDAGRKYINVASEFLKDG